MSTRKKTDSPIECNYSRKNSSKTEFLPLSGQEIRLQAERAIQSNFPNSPEDITKLSPEEIQRTLHELRVHQIELEMQNEELRKIQLELGAARERYFDFFDLAPVGYITISERGVILEANLMAAEILGVVREELTKKHFSRFIFKADQDIYYLHHKQLFENREAQGYELRILRKKGPEIWAHLSSTVTQDPNCDPICHITLVNITERKQTEETLFEQQQVFRTLVENSPDIIARYDRNCQRIYVNPAYLKTAQIPQQELLTTSPIQLSPLPAASASVLQNLLRKVLDSGVSEAVDVIWPQVDNINHWFDISAFPEYDHKGQVVSVMTVSRDITERKRTEEEHKAQIRSLESLDRIDQVIKQETNVEKMMRNVVDTVFSIFDCDRAWLFYPCDPDVPSFRVPVEINRPEYPGANVQDIDLPMSPDLAQNLREALESDDPVTYVAGTEKPINNLTAEQFGVQSQILVPLYPKLGKPWVFSMHQCSYPRVWTKEEIKLVKEISRRVSDGLSSVLFLRELQENEERFRAIFEQAAVGIAHVSLNGQLLEVNQKFCDIVGYTKEELLQKTFQEITYSDDLNENLKYINQILAGEIQTYSMEKRYICKDGSLVWINLTVSINNHIHNEQGYFISVIEDISERKLANEISKQRFFELEALHDISNVLRSAKTSEEALPLLLEETLKALKTNAGTIWLYNPDINELQSTVSRGWFEQIKESSIRPGEGIAGTVFSSQQLHLSTEFRNDSLAYATTREQLPLGWGGICLPICTGKVAIGVIFVSVPSEHPIVPEQVKLLESLTDMAGVTLHRMSLYEETVNQLDRLQSLQKIDQAIIASTDLRLTLNILLEHIATQLKVDAADVLLFNPNTLMLEFTAGRGFRTHAIENTHIRLGESYAGLVALERRAVRLNNSAIKQESKPFTALWVSEEFADYYAVPLIVKGQVKGVLELFHRAPMATEQNWVNFLETLSVQTAIAIENAQLFDQLQRSNIDLSLAYDATLEGWARALDLRDKETEGHTQRVTELTVILARAMGISESKAVHVRRGALLHDIGKMGVPDSILLKPGELTEEEWKLMRQHPQYAFDMLAPIDFLNPALDIPYCHHEKWDGSGYPRGLKGEQIPLVARLFAVVDVWDALLSDRPYRKSWSKEKTINYIKAGIGTHFDPKVVQIFLSEMGL